MEYRWNAKDIIKSNANKITKEIILGELANNLSRLDEVTTDYSKLTHLEHIIYFRKNENMIKDYSNNIYNIAFNLYKLIPQEIMCQINVPSFDTTPEFLINIIASLANYINDDEIMDIISKISNPQNGILNIDYKNSKNITQYIKGRNIKDLDHDFVMASFYISNSIEDIPIFAHEIGHLISGLLFKKNINPNFYNVFNEVESYLMELIMDYYLKVLGKNELSDLLRIKRLVQTSIYSYSIPVQKELCTLSKRDLIALNQRLKRFNMYIHDNDQLDEILSESVVQCYNISISYLIALKLFNRFIDDKESTIKEYKSLFLDKEENIDKLLYKHDINLNDTNELQNEVSLALSKLKR